MQSVSEKSAEGDVSRRTVEELLAEADIEVNGKRPWDPQIHRVAFFDRVLSEGRLGLGESYMDGWWDVQQLDEFFNRVLRAELHARAPMPKLLLATVRARLLNLQSPSRSQRVAKQHYDLGNRFYECMLDPWMQYTCAYWKDAHTLAEAQEAKLDLVCRKLQLQPGEHVLELGGGWGGFARFAAEHYGCRVTSYNISGEQVEYARTFCKGLPVEVVHADYREAEGEFDKVLSIGICEHIGVRNHYDFLSLQARCLRKNGLMLLHTIGSNITKTVSDPWFTKYIFPGGQLPSLKQLMEASEELFILEDLHNIGADYDPTLMCWFRNFDSHWPDFQKAYGETFYRMWTYYLLSCAGAFRARSIQLWQLVFSRDGVSGGYTPVR